jgi:hypothetical protein
MPVNVANIPFEGPHFQTNELQEEPGIYAILDYPIPGQNPLVLDIGESGSIRTRIAGHDRSPQWRRHATGRIGCAVFYTPGWGDFQRRMMEDHLRQRFTPPCGDR